MHLGQIHSVWRRTLVLAVGYRLVNVWPGPLNSHKTLSKTATVPQLVQLTEHALAAESFTVVCVAWRACIHASSAWVLSGQRLLILHLCLGLCHLWARLAPMPWMLPEEGSERICTFQECDLAVLKHADGSHSEYCSRAHWDADAPRREAAAAEAKIRAQSSPGSQAQEAPSPMGQATEDGIEPILFHGERSILPSRAT